MNYLLDTCVLSEFTKRKPDGRIIKWMDSIEEEKIFISAITIGEIQNGVERLPESVRKSERKLWLNTALLNRFGERILAIDQETMLVWGLMTAKLENEGHPMGVMDSLIAATVIKNNMILVTRNVSDFHVSTILQVYNPWIT